MRALHTFNAFLSSCFIVLCLRNLLAFSTQLRYLVCLTYTTETTAVCGLQESSTYIAVQADLPDIETFHQLTVLLNKCQDNFHSVDSLDTRDQVKAFQFSVSSQDYPQSCSSSHHLAQASASLFPGSLTPPPLLPFCLMVPQNHNKLEKIGRNFSSTSFGDCPLPERLPKNAFLADVAKILLQEVKQLRLNVLKPSFS